MNSLQILKAKINLKATIIKFNNSIEEIKKKHPDRKDLIDSMLDSLDDVEQFQSVFLAELKHEIDKLQIEIIDLNRDL